MLTFVIPFRPLQGYAAAAQVIELLNTTLCSVIQQTESNWRVKLVTSEMIELAVADERIEQITPANALKSATRDITAAYGDMHLKRRFGTESAFASGARHVMFLDADDLIHKDLVKFVCERDADQSYLADSGWELIGNTGRILLRKKSFAARCGSCAVVSKKVFDTGCFNGSSSRDSSCYYHHNYVTILTRVNASKLALPMVVYRTEHAGNFTLGLKDLTSFREAIRQCPRLIRLGGKLLLSRKYSGKLKESFG